MTVQKGEIVFTLDGRKVKASPEETVLIVARREGVAIPALCHHKAVTDYGACRLCAVEAKRGSRSRIVTSCLYMPSPDEVIETASDRVKAVRRLVLELLIARCPDVEVIRALADEYGVRAGRLRSTPANRKEERCILCGLCVRVCAEVIGQHAIGFAHRGSGRAIGTPYGIATEDCIGCGACAFVCPTAAIHCEDAEGRRFMREFATPLALRECGRCGRPFATERQLERIRKALPAIEETVALCPSCRRAAFSEAAGRFSIQPKE